MAAFTQDIRFAQTTDALNIAYAVSGRGYPLVRTATWLSNDISGLRKKLGHHVIETVRGLGYRVAATP